MDAVEQLERRRGELMSLLARLDADDDSLRLDRADGTADDEHDPEGSTLSGEWPTAPTACARDAGAASLPHDSRCVRTRPCASTAPPRA